MQNVVTKEEGENTDCVLVGGGIALNLHSLEVGEPIYVLS